MPKYEPQPPFPLEGGCACKHVRYRLETPPLIVNCCHCRWCQRETGSAFALNAMLETERVTDLGAPPEMVMTPSESGRGQLVARCPQCRVAVWSHYQEGLRFRFMRVGTLDRPDCCPPDAHIFTASMQPWVVLPQGVPAWEGLYEREDVWSKESLERIKGVLGQSGEEDGREGEGSGGTNPAIE